MSKLIVIVGITGNQGGSVAQRFLQDPTYRIRGLTRNPSSPAAQALAAKGIEIVRAELDDPATLVSAFQGANLIFSVTQYWEPFFRPDCRAQAESQGISCRRFAYDVEYRQGKNIADAAAATVATLDDNGFMASTLSSAKRCTNGKLQDNYHFDSKADIFPDYVAEHHPALAAKMSCIWTGVFMTSWRLALYSWFKKQPDGTFQTLFPTTPDAPLPHLDVNKDMGPFVHAVSRLPPGRTYMAAGTTCSWSDFDRVWSATTGHKCEYRQITTDEMIALADDKEAAREIAVMFDYASDPGYDGGVQGVWGAEEIRKAGVECPMTTLEEFMAREDWSDVYNQ